MGPTYLAATALELLFHSSVIACGAAGPSSRCAACEARCQGKSQAVQGWDVAAIVRFPPGARARAGDLGDGVARATYRFQVAPLPLPSQAQAEECADTPELHTVCFRSKQGGAAAFNHKLSIWCCADTPELHMVCFCSKQGGAAACDHKVSTCCRCRSRVSRTRGINKRAMRSPHRRT